MLKAIFPLIVRVIITFVPCGCCLRSVYYTVSQCLSFSWAENGRNFFLWWSRVVSCHEKAAKLNEPFVVYIKQKHFRRDRQQETEQNKTRTGVDIII